MKKTLFAFLILFMIPVLCLAETTDNLGLSLPSRGAENWDVDMRENFSIIDDEVGDLQTEIEDARGGQTTLDTRLDGADADFLVGHNSDGSHKTTVSASEWVQSGHTATQYDSNTFQIAGADYTTTYTQGRRVNLYYSSADHYMTVTAVSYTGGNTRVDVDGTVPATITRLDYSILSDNSAPRKITGTLLIEGNLETNISAATPAASYSFDMSGAGVQTYTLSANTSFDVTNIPATSSKTVTIRISAHSSNTYTISFASSAWAWATDKPNALSLAPGEKGLLSITNFGSAAGDIVAGYAPLDVY